LLISGKLELFLIRWETLISSAPIPRWTQSYIARTYLYRLVNKWIFEFHSKIQPRNSLVKNGRINTVRLWQLPMTKR